MRDLWWDLTLLHPSQLKEEQRQFMLTHFFSINWDRHIKPVPGYNKLLQRRGARPQDIDPALFQEQELLDLQVHFNLAWMGYSARKESELVKELVARGGGYSQEDKERLLEEQMALMARVLPRFKALEERGQIELTSTPLFHPILPLLVDSDVARRCQPERPLPSRFAWPQDAAWHVEQACAQHERQLGQRPRGMWPAEGSVSPEVLPLFARAGVRWIASDEDTLMGSSPRSSHREDALYRPYTLSTPEGPVHMIFRDHMISDLVGFTYANTPAERAAEDLLAHVLEAGQRAHNTEAPLVPIILDGENPWEAYPNDGEFFQRALYEKLRAHPHLTSVRVCDFLEERGAPDTLTHLHSGSWIMGNYQIWIGASETNTAWDLLGQAREAVERARTEDSAAPEAIEEAQAALYAAEGSDWFWWYGDDFSSDQDAEFDSLFRGYLRAAWRALGQAPPPRLSQPISQSSPQSIQVEPPRNFLAPHITGRLERYFDWAGAGRYEPHGGAGSMFRAHVYLEAMHFGFDLERLYLRLDPGPDWYSQNRDSLALHVLIWPAHQADASTWRARVELADPVSLELPQGAQGGQAAFDQILEVALPFASMGVSSGQDCHLQVVLLRDGIEIDRQPPQAPLLWSVPDDTFEERHWFV
jgi:alpha-amylase/alpha-mannosidase (GH57 family)